MQVIPRRVLGTGHATNQQDMLKAAYGCIWFEYGSPEFVPSLCHLFSWADTLHLKFSGIAPPIKKAFAPQLWHAQVSFPGGEVFFLPLVELLWETLPRKGLPQTLARQLRNFLEQMDLTTLGAWWKKEPWTMLKYPPLTFSSIAWVGLTPSLKRKNGSILVETWVISKISLEKVFCGLNLAAYSLLQAGILIGANCREPAAVVTICGDCSTYSAASNSREPCWGVQFIDEEVGKRMEKVRFELGSQGITECTWGMQMCCSWGRWMGPYLNVHSAVALNGTLGLPPKRSDMKLKNGQCSFISIHLHLHREKTISRVIVVRLPAWISVEVVQPAMALTELLQLEST